MARKISIDPEDIQRAEQLRDQATTVSEYRKALSVILVAEYGLDVDRVADALGTSRRTVFRDRSNIRSQDDTSKKTWGGRRNSAMTIEEERKDFLADSSASSLFSISLRRLARLFKDMARPGSNLSGFFTAKR